MQRDNAFVLNWSIWQSDPAGWDAGLMQFPDSTVYQSHGWGEHRRRSGWHPQRLVATEHGQTVAVAQVLIRKFPLNVALAWVPSGPVGPVEAWGVPFRAAIREAIGVRQLYCRLNSLREYAETDAQAMLSAGWNRPRHPMLSGKSILLSLDEGEDDWLRSIDAKHRYYVRKSAGAALTWKHGNTAALRRDLETLTRKLSEEKSMDLHGRDAGALEILGSSMPGAVQILVGYLDGEPVTGCLVLVHNTKAHYEAAATVGRGRDVSAAYCMFARLRGILREQKILQLDFGGINPESDKARGVDHFKSGFGGRPVRYLGEWDWAASPLLRFAANYMIKRRARGI